MAASKPLTLSDPRMIAEFVRQSEFKGLFEQRFAVPPDIAAMLFRNGELVDAFKGGHFSVGGLVNSLKGMIGGSSHIGMLIADLKPFQIQTTLQALSSDHVEVAGVVTIEMQVDTDKPANILGMMHGVSRAPDKADGNNDGVSDSERLGRLALSRADVHDRIRPHLEERVFAQGVSRVSGEELRGNVGLQDKIQADLMQVVEQFAGRMGLVVNGVSVQFARNESEVAAMEKASIERQMDMAEFQVQQLLRQMKMQNDAQTIVLESEMDGLRLQQANEDELKDMALMGEVRFIDARETQARRQELEALAHEVELLKSERIASFSDEIAQMGHAANMGEAKRKLVRINEDIEQFTFEAEMRRNKILREYGREQEDKDWEAQFGRQTALDKQNLSNIRGMTEIEQQTYDRDHGRTQESLDNATRRKAMEARAEAEAFAARANAVKNLERDQIMALGAMLSPDVAAVLAEEARLKATSNEDAVARMEQMVSAAQQANVQNSAQALEMLKVSMDGAARVAAGAGGGRDPGPAAHSAPAGSSPASATELECPKCARMNPASFRFCPGCKTQLRT